ncbi:MAG: ribonuclease R [Peptococcaceae bacterium]|nr:ribonuclease R [Peptococcaceae bacterium]
MIEKDKWIVGTFEKLRGFGYVTPDSRKEIQEIMVLQDDSKEAKTGDKVTVRVYPEGYQGRLGVYGEILEILGPANQSEVQMRGILKKHYLSEEFPPDVLKAAEAAPRALGQEAIEGRRDLTGLPAVTIDGSDAKDLDDAVSLESLEAGNVRLGVHIADVGWYVREGSALDLEALARGTSVYFPDRVLPMLPPGISNDLCSLNAGAPRLTVSCIMDLDGQGKLLRYEILPTLIQVTRRLTYDQVQDFLDQKTGFAEDARIRDMLSGMAEVCRVLREKRFERGALDFDLPECKIVMQDGKPADIIRREHRLAEAMIEEFMILANETVAAHFQKLGVPFIYRVHEEPGPDSIAELNPVLSAFGLSVKVDKKGKVRSATYQKLLNLIKERPEAQTVHTLLLRSMNHARYDSRNLGHFGLASQEYCHFTSPIRRYADLAIHRVIREAGMEGKISPERGSALEKQMQRFAEQASEREKTAETAERDVESFRKAEYMAAFVGQEFDGIISSVTEFGFYVRLPNTVEGLVHVSRLDGYYVFNEKRLRLESEQRKTAFSIGDEVRVHLMSAEAQSGFINFSWLPPQTESRQNQNKNSGERKKSRTGRGRGTKSARADGDQVQVKEAQVKEAQVKGDAQARDAQVRETQAQAKETRAPAREKQVKEVQVKGIQVKDAQMKNSQVKETQAKETQAKDTQTKETQTRKPQVRQPQVRRTQANGSQTKRSGVKLPPMSPDERDRPDELQGFKYTAKTLADWINPDKYDAAQAPVRRRPPEPIRLPGAKPGSKPIRLPESKSPGKPPRLVPDSRDEAQVKPRRQQKKNVPRRQGDKG